MKFDRKTKHDINAIFSKIQTSVELLKTDLSTEEKQAVLSILENSANRLKTFCNALLLSFIKIKPEDKEINLARYFSLDEEYKIITDPKIAEIIVNVIKTLNKSSKITAKIEKDLLIIEGDFSPQDSIEEFLIEFLNNASKLIHAKINVSKRYIKVGKENEHTFD